MGRGRPGWAEHRVSLPRKEGQDGGEKRGGALKPLLGMRLVLPLSIKDTKTLGFTESFLGKEEGN